MINTHYSQFIRNEATRLGFMHCGIAKAEKLEEDAKRLETWLTNNHHGQMHYMANHFDKRIDPRLLVEGAKSVVSLLLNYTPSIRQEDGIPKIATYAYGNDYHDVIRNKLNELLYSIRDHIGEVSGRGFVDSAPVLERSWAVRSGAGWIGKNGNLISKKNGSLFFIATLILDLELEVDIPFTTDHCGTCTRCIDACPTDAILPDKVIDGSRCISYFTIELKEQLIPSEKTWSDWIFGCDICQDVCPWNRFAKVNNEESFKPIPEILNYSMNDWLDLTEETFRVVFKNSPLKRAKFSGIRRNLSFIHPNDI